MRPLRISLTILITIACANAVLARPAQACKPCLGDPLERAMKQAAGVLLGRISLVSENRQGAEKRGAGEATLEVQVERWLARPAGKKPPQGQKTTLRIRWDGICVGRPALPAAGDRAIFFIAELGADGGGVLIGACATPYLHLEKEVLTLPPETHETWGSSSLSLRGFQKKLARLRKKPEAR